MRSIHGLVSRAMPVPALVLAAGCAFLGGGGEANESPQQEAARVQQESRIAREVMARLAAEPAVDASGIRPLVVQNEVHLHGTVAGHGALRCAMANAELVAGVRLVVDYLVVQPGPSHVNCLAPRVFTMTGENGGRSGGP